MKTSVFILSMVLMAMSACVPNFFALVNTFFWFKTSFMLPALVALIVESSKSIHDMEEPVELFRIRAFFVVPFGIFCIALSCWGIFLCKGLGSGMIAYCVSFLLFGLLSITAFAVRFPKRIQSKNPS